MHDNLDQISSWCDSNHMVLNPIKSNIATRKKHQLSPLPLDLFIRGVTRAAWMYPKQAYFIDCS